MESPVMSPARKEPDTSTYSGQIGARIRELREAKALSLREIVEQLAEHGITTTIANVSHWEVGRTEIRTNLLPPLAAILKVKPRDLLPPN